MAAAAAPQHEPLWASQSHLNSVIHAGAFNSQHAVPGDKRLRRGLPPCFWDSWHVE